MEKMEGKGAKCPKCETIYPEDQERCTNCGINTEPTTYYIFERINRERLVFIASFSIIVGLATLVITGKIDTAGIGFLGSLIVVSSAFHTGNFLFGVGGGFKDRFIKEKNEIDESELAFSWSKVFKDFVVLLVITVLVSIALGIAELWKSL